MREIIKQILQEEVRKDVLQKSIQDNGFAFTAITRSISCDAHLLR